MNTHFQRRAVCCLLATIALCSSLALAEPVVSSLSHRELRHLLRAAHTPAEYHALADFYRAEQNRLQQQAASEHAEWMRRASMSSEYGGLAVKYPSPVETARTRYEYLNQEAIEMQRQAAHFAQLEANTR